MAIFKSPVGDKEARNSGKLWPEPWVDANKYLNHYDLGYHTGADLNRRDDQDRGEEVFAIGDGKVKYAEYFPNSATWGNIVVIYHGVVDNLPLFSRYAHLQSMDVKVDDIVTSDTRIGNIGTGAKGSTMNAHLHFDISTTSALFGHWGDWPGENKHRVELDYVDPLIWLQKPHILNIDAIGKTVNESQTTGGQSNIAAPTPSSNTILFYVTARAGAKMRKDLKSAAELELPYGVSFSLPPNPKAYFEAPNYWVQITEGDFKDYWVTYSNEAKTEKYISNIKPQ